MKPETEMREPLKSRHIPPDEKVSINPMQPPKYEVIFVHGRHIKMSPLAYKIFRLMEEGETVEEIKNRIKSDLGISLSVETISYLYESIVQRVQSITDSPSASESMRGFFLRRDLVSAHRVVKWSSYLSFFFTLPFKLLWLPLIMVVSWKVVLPFHAEHLTGGAWIIGYLLFVMSLLVHELGHSTALLRHQAQPGKIGVTLYLIYPAFYSDVTNAWLLPKWQRVEVDFGGIYLQGLLAILYGVTYLLTDASSLQIATVLIIYTMAFNLNPILKFDGYWLLSDLFEIPNLHAQIFHFPKLVFGCIRKGCRWPWTFFTTAFLVTYEIFVVLAVLLGIFYFPGIIEKAFVNLYRFALLLLSCANFTCHVSRGQVFEGLSAFILILGAMLSVINLMKWILTKVGTFSGKSKL